MLSLLELVFWTVLSTYYLSTGQYTTAWACSLITLAWLYSFVRLLVKPSAKPPYDVLTLLVIQLMTAAVVFLGHGYNHYGYAAPWPAPWVIIGEMLDLSIIFSLVVVILQTPVEAVPKSTPDTLASPEDRATLWGWMTFGFVNPLVAKVRQEFYSWPD